MGQLSRADGAFENAELVYGRLRQMAVEGRLRPDRRLEPHRIALHFETTIAIARQTLARLASEGFIAAVATAGYFTKPVSVDEQRQLIELNQVLFAACVERALPRLTQDRLEAMAKLVVGAHDDASAQYHVRAQERLNHAIADLADNVLMADLFKLNLDRTHLIRRIDMESVSGTDQSAQTLRALAQMVRKGEIAAMVAGVRLVVDGRLQRLPSLVDKANALSSRMAFP